MNVNWFVMVDMEMCYDWEKDRHVESKEKIYKFANYDAAKRCYDRKDPNVLKTRKVERVDVSLGAGDPDDDEMWKSDGWIIQPGCMTKRSD